jgi:hypothetical protein
MIKIAIKFPKICDNIGLSYIDINKWIETIYKNNIWLGWLVYNDQTNHIKNTCKKYYNLFNFSHNQQKYILMDLVCAILKVNKKGIDYKRVI